MHTLLEKKSLLSKWVQRKTISTALLEATVSSAWTVISPRFLKTSCLLLFLSLNDKLLLGLVTICRTHSSHQRHSVATISILNATVLTSSTMKMNTMILTSDKVQLVIPRNSWSPSFSVCRNNRWKNFLVFKYKLHKSS